MGFYPERSDAEEIKQLKAELKSAHSTIEHLKKDIADLKQVNNIKVDSLPQPSGKQPETLDDYYETFAEAFRAAIDEHAQGRMRQVDWTPEETFRLAQKKFKK
jgi:predicted RNase H-like nuclease (RuvC/YqgF family)